MREGGFFFRSSNRVEVFVFPETTDPSIRVTLFASFLSSRAWEGVGAEI